MGRLQKLVPPIELCKLIPAGEFADSALIWVDEKNGVIPAELVIRKKYDIPAPTLQEIMAELQYIRVYKKTQNFYVAVKDQERVASFNGATAALKLWLKKLKPFSRAMNLVYALK